MSPMRVASPIATANFEASGVAVYAMTSWSPVVSGSIFPLAASTRTRFERAFSVVVRITERPSGVQKMAPGRLPRGGRWSPARSLPGSKS